MTELFDFSTFPILQTERLILRQLRHEDAEHVLTLFSSPEVLAFLDLEPLESRENALGLLDWFNGLFKSKASLQWAVTLKDDTWVGTCGNYAWEKENRKIEIGYNILPVYWGKGYATEATHAILRWSFENLDLHRIEGDCTDGNIASEKVMLNCGFQYEGTRHEDHWEHECFVDTKLFGLLRRNYLGESEGEI
jgi:ribosomal-protein-alanine N-acetyltransferase